MTGPEGVALASPLEIRRLGLLRYRLSASQALTCPREKAFAFFKDPSNLCRITPAWLGFCLIDGGRETPVQEGAEYDYTIRWLGFRMGWQSRIVDYHPPERFTDIQLRGPYRSWVHTHAFASAPEGTLMKDTVTYGIPLYALPAHWLIRRQLTSIFTFRRDRIAAWVRGIVSGCK